MNYPKLSFGIALIIWFFLVFFAANFLVKSTKIIPPSLEIEASSLLNEFHQNDKSATKKSNQKELQHDLLNANTNSNSKNIIPLYQPLPAIPDELRQEAFNSYAIARFNIAPDGSIAFVELIKPCNNPKLNQLLLKSLKNWKFPAKNEASNQDIRVNFEVK